MSKRENQEKGEKHRKRGHEDDSEDEIMIIDSDEMEVNEDEMEVNEDEMKVNEDEMKVNEDEMKVNEDECKSETSNSKMKQKLKIDIARVVEDTRYNFGNNLDELLLVRQIQDEIQNGSLPRNAASLELFKIKCTKMKIALNLKNILYTRIGRNNSEAKWQNMLIYTIDCEIFNISNFLINICKEQLNKKDTEKQSKKRHKKLAKYDMSSTVRGKGNKPVTTYLASLFYKLFDPPELFNPPKFKINKYCTDQIIKKIHYIIKHHLCNPLIYKESELSPLMLSIIAICVCSPEHFQKFEEIFDLLIEEMRWFMPDINISDILSTSAEHNSATKFVSKGLTPLGIVAPYIVSKEEGGITNLMAFFDKLISLGARSNKSIVYNNGPQVIRQGDMPILIQEITNHSKLEHIEMYNALISKLIESGALLDNSTEYPSIYGEMAKKLAKSIDDPITSAILNALRPIRFANSIDMCSFINDISDISDRLSKNRPSDDVFKQYFYLANDVIHAGASPNDEITVNGQKITIFGVLIKKVAYETTRKLNKKRTNISLLIMLIYAFAKSCKFADTTIFDTLFNQYKKIIKQMRDEYFTKIYVGRPHEFIYNRFNQYMMNTFLPHHMRLIKFLLNTHVSNYISIDVTDCQYITLLKKHLTWQSRKNFAIFIASFKNSYNAAATVAKTVVVAETVAITETSSSNDSVSENLKKAQSIAKSYRAKTLYYGSLFKEIVKFI